MANKIFIIFKCTFAGQTWACGLNHEQEVHFVVQTYSLNTKFIFILVFHTASAQYALPMW